MIMRDTAREASGKPVFDVLDSMGIAALLVDRQRYVVGFNMLAARIETELQIVNGRLEGADPSTTSKLARLVETTLTGEASRRAIAIRREKELPIIIHGIRIEGVATTEGDALRTLLLVIDPCRKVANDHDQLREAFGLSSTEVRVALRLASGDSLQEAAAVCGISYESARTLIKSVYRKTGTNRQSSLVALIHGMSIVPLA
jgi:DNA-binding CsgD family transcriptional regulator